MTESLLSMIPTYGLWFVLAVMILSCLAVPLPASILVMTAGGFASGGDLVFWQVAAAAFIGYVIGDQLAYNLARLGGTPLLERIERGKAGTVFGKARVLLVERGAVAVFLSRTILSPLGPYVGYLSGAVGVNWFKFTGAAMAGAALWTTAYVGLGFTFASRITEIASLISNALGFILAAFVLVGIALWLRRSWRQHQIAQQGA